MEEQVILVDHNDQAIGMMEKQEAHVKGLLHRAFSVFVFNDRGEFLLQQRAAHKYHSPKLWTNTCCSHQRPGESNVQAGKRRLQEEMGFTTELQVRGSFTYKASFDNGLTEHEFDYILTGVYNAEPKPNPKEVMAYRWLTLEELEEELQRYPEHFTAWFKIIFREYKNLVAHQNTASS
ncbi:MAG: isopentenyl-diphosphate Delta-isomerase [Flavobacteriaceae bacterium]|nr:isopentenyl-diphosphate Delta-isomerase [Flavobacteriaceae bacterium]